MKEEIIQCACGCGQTRNKFDTRGRARLFINGHQKKADWVKNEISKSLKGKRPKNFELLRSKSPFVKGHAQLNTGRTHFKEGQRPTNFKGGTLNGDGYKLIYANGKQEREHRLIMESHLGRKLSSKEHVHHIDGNKLNNSIKNLMLFANAIEHAKYHEQIKGEVTYG